MIKQTSILILVAATVWLLLSTVRTSAQSQDSLAGVVAQLTVTVEKLQSRVERLEHAADAIYEAVEGGEEIGDAINEYADAPKLVNAPGGRYMWLDAVEEDQPADMHEEEIADLQKEIEALEKTAERQRKKVTSEEGRAAQGTRRGGTGNSRAGSPNRTQRDQAAISRLKAERRLLRNYTRELAAKKSELKDLERSAGSPRQILIGHEGDTIITLHTERDLSGPLSNVNIGDPIAWTGRRTEMERGSERWRIETIRKLEARD
jgi:hypothetical protein